jgi:hypothetical protein
MAAAVVEYAFDAVFADHAHRAGRIVDLLIEGSAERMPEGNHGVITSFST